MLYCSCILYNNHARRYHQTKSLTPFFCLSNIATTPIMKNNTTLLRLLSQSDMFNYVTAFNLDISDWNVGSGTSFVSGMGLWES